jgi:polyhydroxyalkanoate synthase
MFPPFWGLPPATNAVLQQMQRELEQMKNRFGAAFKTLLEAEPVAVAQTPAEVVYTENKLRLLHYHPVVEHPYPVPLLMVPSLINRYYILDLIPGKSLVEYLVRRGIDVYMLDWGIPGSEDRFIPFDQYISGYLRRVVQRVCARAGQQRISLLGYCIGGTFTAIFTALYGQYVRNLIQLTAPINFHDEGLLSQWTRKEHFNVDLIVDTLGNMPAELMQASFRLLKPTAQIAQQIALAEKLGDLQAVQDFLAMQTWINDNIPFPGEAYRKYIKECYQENHLVQGKLVVDGQRVDLAQITCALLIIIASKDHICPPQSAAVLDSLVSSTDKQVLEIPGGHIGIVAGRSASGSLWPRLADWLIARSDVQPAAEQPPPPSPPADQA